MMKRYIKGLSAILATIVALVAFAAYADNGSGAGYDPSSPPDPDLRYRVKTSAAPSNGGYTGTFSDGLYAEGDVATVYADSNNGFIFKEWRDGDTVVSTDSYYSFTMPANSVKLTAFFEYDPTSPDDPMSDGYTHSVKIYITPSGSGYVGDQYFLMKEGETRHVWAYSHSNFKFEGWRVDGKILSPNADGTPQNPLLITMGDSNLEYTAVYSYSPQSPEEPGLNNFNAATGELIIDSFTEDNLMTAILSVLERGNYQSDVISQVIDFTVAGTMSYWDCFVIEQMPLLERLDLSRTNLNEFELEVFTYGEQKENLKTIIFPSTLNYVNNDLNSTNIASIESIYCYAVTPPIHQYGINSEQDTYDIDLYVPLESVPLYQEDSYWKRYNILSMDSNDYGINVSFADGVDIETYRNMTIVLSDNKVGTEKKYVVNGRTSYAYSNLIPSTEAMTYSYSVTLITKDGYELAKVTGIQLTEADPIQNVVLSPIGLHDLEVSVVDEDGNDLTESLNITWTEPNGTYLSVANPYVGVPEGKEVKVSFTLPSTLSSTYKTPESLTMRSGDEPALISLEKYATYDYSGIVTDQDGKPVVGASVTVYQILNSIINTLHALTDRDGKFSLKLLEAGTISNAKIEADGFNNLELSIVDNKLPSEIPTMQPLSGDKINVSLLWKAVGANENVPYADPNNVSFNVPGHNFKLEYPYIHILDEVDPDKEITVEVSSLNGTFSKKSASTKIVDKEGLVEFVLTEFGGISALLSNWSNDRTINAMLFNDNGDVMVRTQAGEHGASFSNYEDGHYTVVLIESNRFVNGIGNLNRFSDLGLTRGEDYLAADATVEEGENTEVSFGEVPELDKEKFGDIDSSTTVFTVNKSSVTSGAYVTVRSTINFKSDLKDRVSDVKVRFDIPEGTRFVSNSLVRKNSSEDYYLGSTSGGYFIANNYQNGETIKFCIMPNQKGNFYPSATVEYYIDGVRYEQPAGDAFFMGVDQPIYAPAKTCREYVYARGVTNSLSNVELKTNGVYGGSVTSLADGSWVAKVDLNNVEENPTQSVQGHITTPTANEFTTEPRTVEYDKYYPELNMVRMIHNGYAVDFDHSRAKTSAKSYSYNPSYDMYSLTASFDENKERITEVNFHILASDGSERTIDGVYNTSSGIWMAALSYPDSYCLPVNVSVDYTYNKPVPSTESGENVDTSCNFYMGYIAPDVVPIIDPSGFVYEAVESNRLEGVECTVFYREGYENSIGEIDYRVTRWNAEEYAQENPLFTKEDGSYAWDVPSGDWQVRFVKDGYDTAYSDWLPVPPPQLEVNIAMVQNVTPAVSIAKAYSDGVVVAFDKHMDISTITPDNVFVTTVADGNNTGEAVDGTIKYTVTTADGIVAPVDTIRFVPANAFSVNTGKINLTIRKAVKSYAGMEMAEDYNQELTLEKEITSIGFNVESIEIGVAKKVVVSATDADATKGKTLVISNKSPYVSEISDYEVVLDANGQAEVTLTGLLEGDAIYNLKIDDYETTAAIKVVMPSTVVTKPYASLPAGEVYVGTKIALASDELTTIYYTIDGSDPTVENGIIYTAPIEVTEGMTIKAIAVNYQTQSQTASYTYSLKKSSLQLNLQNGWNWISHNLMNSVDVNKFNVDGVTRILSQTKENVNDPKLGLVGTIYELNAQESYKVQTTTDVTINLADVAYNPSQTWDLQTGWNWIGYPVDQAMTPDEAFATTYPEVGDIVVGRDGFATYNGEDWISEISGFTLNPGSGYLYMSKSAKELSYDNSKVSTAAFLSVRRLAAAPVFGVDKTKYPSILPVIAVVKKENGEYAESGEYTVAAFSNGECRGLGKFVDGYLLMSVYGNPGDEISFGYTVSDAEQTVLLPETFSVGDEPIGSLASPYVIDLGSQTGINGVFNSDDVDITVANNVLYVYGDGVSQVSLFNVNGVKVLSANGEKAAAGISLSGLRAGVHVVSVECAGKWSYHKIIVK